jgi:hypothetical protein
MLQVFYLDIAKVDLNVAYRCMLQAYVLSFRCFIRMFVSVLSECYICLQRFSNIFQAFLQVFQTLVSSVSFLFFLYVTTVASEVLKVDQNSHGMRVGSGRWRGRCSGRRGDVRDGMDPLLVRSLMSSTRYALIYSLCAAASGRYIQTLASPMIRWLSSRKWVVNLYYIILLPSPILIIVLLYCSLEPTGLYAPAVHLIRISLQFTIAKVTLKKSLKLQLEYGKLVIFLYR